MCVKSLKQNYADWTENKPIHPLTLMIRDKELQSKYDDWARS